MPYFIAIASGFQDVSKLRMDVWRADRDGHHLAFQAADEDAARAIAVNFLKDNLGGNDLELLHLDIIEVAGP